MAEGQSWTNPQNELDEVCTNPSKSGCELRPNFCKNLMRASFPGCNPTPPAREHRTSISKLGTMKLTRFIVQLHSQQCK